MTAYPEVPVKLRKALAHFGVALLSLPVVPASADPATSPAGQPSQWIVVGVPAADATTGTLTAFERVGQQWKVVLGPTPAKVGALGVGAPADGVHRTPVGTFRFDQAFGRQPNPGTKMPYFQATNQDWWDEDARSSTYNTHVRRIRQSLVSRGKPVRLGHGLRLRRQHRCKPPTDSWTGVREVLHVTDGSPTWGCVAIGRDEMRAVLTWLNPAAAPADHDQHRNPVACVIQGVIAAVVMLLWSCPPAHRHWLAGRR